MRWRAQEGESRVFGGRTEKRGEVVSGEAGKVNQRVKTRDTQEDTGLQTTYNDLESKDIEIPAACVCCCHSKHATTDCYSVLQHNFYANVL